MRRLKVCISALFAVFAVAAVAAATASALPTVHPLSGESWTTTPLKVEAKAEGAGVASLSTALSAPITSSKVKVTGEAKELTSLFPYTAEFTGAAIEGKECKTEGDAAGTILVTKNEAHLVWSKLSPELDLLILFLVSNLTIVCGVAPNTLTITVSGSVLGNVTGLTDMKDAESFVVDLKCTKPGNGKQAFKEYFNDEGKLIKGVLTANLGLGPETACEEVTKTVTATANKMFEPLF